MERWSGRVAVVTGASSGIGEAITRALVSNGMKVAALARRIDRLKELEAELKKSGKGSVKGIQCDVTKEEDILKAFKEIHDSWGGVSIVVNNAGVAKQTDVTEGSMEDWKVVIDTNMIGPSLCSREGLRSMKAHGIDDGHIIFINSILGHIHINFPPVAFYSASKHALKVLTGYLQKTLAAQKSKIRVTSISPGLVETEMTTNLPKVKDRPWLFANDISDAVLYTISTPGHVNISEMIIQPTGETAPV